MIGTPDQAQLASRESLAIDAHAVTTAHERAPRSRCPRTVLDLVIARAEDRHAALAVADGVEELTRGALTARSRTLARRLRPLGVGAETVAAVLLERSAQFVVAALGVLEAGAAYLPIDPTYPADRIAFMLADAQPRAVVTTAARAAHVPTGPWATIAIDEDVSARDAVTSSALASPDPADLAYLIYTSGSTGRPKGVQITHRNLLNLVGWHLEAFDLTADDRTTQLASPGFDAAAWELWSALAAGASLHVADEATRLDVERLRDWMMAERITVTFVPTPLAERMIGLDWPRETALRLMLTGGETLHRYPPGCLPFALVNNYGPTECTVVATSGRVPPGRSIARLPSIGRPISNTRVHILDEAMRPVPPGTPGEIYIGGAGVGRGYLNLPELTAERFVPDPFSNTPAERLYRTGDLGRWLPDGDIAFEGRADEQIKVRGVRVEPGEIVTALDAHPSVEASTVVARDDASGETRLVAYVVPAPRGAAPTLQSLRTSLTAVLPEAMVPSTFVVLPELPLTTNGKVDRAALPAPDESNTLRDGEYVAPRTIVEERLTAILEDLLGLERVSVTENFFLLGGHSLLAAQVLARVRQELGVEASLRTLFASANVAELAAEIEREILANLDTADVKE